MYKFNQIIGSVITMFFVSGCAEADLKILRDAYKPLTNEEFSAAEQKATYSCKGRDSCDAAFALTKQYLGNILPKYQGKVEKLADDGYRYAARYADKTTGRSHDGGASAELLYMSFDISSFLKLNNAGGVISIKGVCNVSSRDIKNTLDDCKKFVYKLYREYPPYMNKELGNDIISTQPSITQSNSPSSKEISSDSTKSALMPAADSGQEGMASVDIQRRLIAAGYLIGKADGVFGQKSIQALKKFQKANGILETGSADRETLRKLRLLKAP